MIVTCDVPSGVLEDVFTLIATEMGFTLTGLTVFAGWNWQLAPAGKPEHESATAPANEPSPETTDETGALALPGITLTLFGVGGLTLKSKICKVSEKSKVSAFGSEPSACSVNTSPTVQSLCLPGRPRHSAAPSKLSMGTTATSV